MVEMMAINLIPLKNDRSPQPSSDESQETASRTTQTRAGSELLEDVGKTRQHRQSKSQPRLKQTKSQQIQKQTRKRRSFSRSYRVNCSFCISFNDGNLWVYFYNIDAGLQPLDKNNKKLVQVHIPEGSSNKQIAAVLEESNVIKSGMVLTTT